VKVDDRAFDARRVLWLISAAKNALKKATVKTARKVSRGKRGVVTEGAGDDYDLVAAEVMPRYEEALRGQRAVDFDDLIVLPTRMLKEDRTLRARWQARFDHILVDEYQDTNRCQLELLKLLAGEKQNVCAVGDDDQAIYGWRGAEVKNILQFDRHFEGAKEIALTQNYRSTGHVLACANAVIGKNPARKEKRLWTEAGEGARVVTAALPTAEDEARFVAARITDLRREGRKLSEIAVLYRLNAQSQPVEEALREVGIDYDVKGGPAFFDRSEVKDVLAYLKACTFEDDDVSLSRIVNVPARGIGDGSMAKVHDHAVKKGIGLFAAMNEAASIEGLPRGAPERIAAFVSLRERYAGRFAKGGLAEAAKSLITEVDLYSHVRMSVASAEAGSRKVEAVDQVLRSLESYERRESRPSLAGYLNRLALDTREEEPGEQSGVALMTLHAAKGLEFPCVFLVGCEEDLLPCAGIQGEARDLAEERRLAYVGITRARERLWMTRAVTRSRRGRIDPRTPSRFLGDLPPASVELHDPTAAPPSPEEVTARSSDVLAALKARLAQQKGGSGLAP
jgi:DNA helicase-2/ATP-dependent DNA helicase PcrA